MSCTARRLWPLVLFALAVAWLPTPVAAADNDARAGADDYAFSIAWGVFGSTQLLRPEDPAAYWSLTFHFPVVRSWGLDAKIGVDNAVFGDPADVLSALIQPARSGYQLGLGFSRLPSDFRIWYFHVSDHNVDEIAPRVNNDFRWTIGPGGLSDMVLVEKAIGDVVVGGGPAYASRHTNMIPRILEIDGVMLTAVQSAGVIGYLRREFAWGDLQGRAGVLGMFNGQDEDRLLASGEGDETTFTRVKYSRSQLAAGASLTKNFSDFGLTGTVFWGSYDAAISVSASWSFGLEARP